MPNHLCQLISTCTPAGVKPESAHINTHTWRGDAREGAGGSGACRGWSAGTWGAAGASLGGGGRSRCSLTVCICVCKPGWLCAVWGNK
eukprot:1130077-Pelagomonas_calceolata.AAC.2